MACELNVFTESESNTEHISVFYLKDWLLTNSIMTNLMNANIFIINPYLICNTLQLQQAASIVILDHKNGKDTKAEHEVILRLSADKHIKRTLSQFGANQDQPFIGLMFAPITQLQLVFNSLFPSVDLPLIDIPELNKLLLDTCDVKAIKSVFRISDDEVNMDSDGLIKAIMTRTALQDY